MRMLTVENECDDLYLGKILSSIAPLMASGSSLETSRSLSERTAGLEATLEA